MIINSITYIILMLITYGLWYSVYKMDINNNSHNFWKFYFLECGLTSCIINWFTSFWFIINIINLIIRLVIK